MSSVARADTPFRAFSPSPEYGVLTSVHVDPSQCSAAGCTFAPGTGWVPTTQTSFCDTTAIPRGSLTTPELGTIAQLDPQATAGRTAPRAAAPRGVSRKVRVTAVTATAARRPLRTI